MERHYHYRVMIAEESENVVSVLRAALAKAGIYEEGGQPD
jgi:hypothetical protein